MGPQLEKAADLYRYEGFGGIYDKFQEYDFPWTKPGVQWETASPQSVGLDPQALDELRDELVSKNTEALVIIKDGKLVYEWYSPDSGPNRKHSTAAMAKGVTASIALAAAVDEGLIGLDDPAWKYIPQWKDDPVRSRITIRQLGSHSSGLDDVDFPPSDSDPEWKHVYYDNPDLRFSLALSDDPVIAEPGTRYSYSGVGYYALAYALTAALQGSPETDINALIENRVMKPLEIPSSAWEISYGESHEIDGMKMYAFGSGVRQTTRSIARMGQLVLNKGEWNGKQVIAPETIEAITSYEGYNPGRGDSSTLPAMGFGWLLNDDGFLSSLPRDAIIGMGNGPQITLIVPEMDMVMVRIGGSLTDEPNVSIEQTWAYIDQSLLSPVMAAAAPSLENEAFAAHSR